MNIQLKFNAYMPTLKQRRVIEAWKRFAWEFSELEEREKVEFGFEFLNVKSVVPAG